MIQLSPEEMTYSHCQAGHDKHVRLNTHVVLNGSCGLSDVPPIPQRLATFFPMMVYDWNEYGGDTFDAYKEYCPGQDIISFSIVRYGIWEGMETLLALDILKSALPGRKVMDFGCQIGWYSMLAASCGHRVAAIDALAENLELLEESARRGKVLDLVTTYRGVVNENAVALRVDGGPVEFVKIDIEGAEEYAVRMLEPLLVARKIKYLLIEISPVFNDSYPELCRQIMAQGYDAYEVPPKGWEHSSAYGEYPLATLKKYCRVTEAVEEHIATIRQENWLFCRRD